MYQAGCPFLSLLGMGCQCKLEVYLDPKEATLPGVPCSDVLV